jgi:hypothetical protein
MEWRGHLAKELLSQPIFLRDPRSDPMLSRLAAICLTAVTTLLLSARLAAQVVYFNPVNTAVVTVGGGPNTLAFNFFTGAVGTSLGGTPAIVQDARFTTHWYFPSFTNGNSGRTTSLLTSGGNAVVLSAGTAIGAGSAGTWSTSGNISYQGTFGLPRDDTPGYLGFRIVDGGSTYYGWAQISYYSDLNIYAVVTLYDFAYESTAGLSIQAGAIPEPETGALMIAASALGLVAWRRRGRRPA